ncbi:hypothetical protein NEOLI_002357 [Neolecta irregularis DAH-3]|uniref:SAP domain-containing protein n=1 Tax=Neolecta irregularis (strain DAH-3) TaxID=1198029 RepID=A0A1U7LV03_NEOID|nr:hypothetical protein NEOLI_002357 [Neolecta irregularis DAH-3]|eukprot:OLL26474.1 hypothetical protein NEOLI_002357 [Neolecta irregularis DAH-3]
MTENFALATRASVCNFPLKRQRSESSFDEDQSSGDSYSTGYSERDGSYAATISSGSHSLLDQPQRASWLQDYRITSRDIDKIEQKSPKRQKLSQDQYIPKSTELTSDPSLEAPCTDHNLPPFILQYGLSNTHENRQNIDYCWIMQNVAVSNPVIDLYASALFEYGPFHELDLPPITYMSQTPHSAEPIPWHQTIHGQCSFPRVFHCQEHQVKICESTEPLPTPENLIHTLHSPDLAAHSQPTKVKLAPLPASHRGHALLSIDNLDLDDITVTECKKILKQRGEPTTGKKELLISRIKLLQSAQTRICT